MRSHATHVQYSGCACTGVHQLVGMLFSVHYVTLAILLMCVYDVSWHSLSNYMRQESVTVIVFHHEGRVSPSNAGDILPKERETK